MAKIYFSTFTLLASCFSSISGLGGYTLPVTEGYRNNIQIAFELMVFALDKGGKCQFNYQINYIALHFKKGYEDYRTY